MNKHRMACLGAATVQVRTTEYMERCRECGTEVQFQLVNHSLYGFKGGCDRYRASAIKQAASVSAAATSLPDFAHEKDRSQQGGSSA